MISKKNSKQGEAFYDSFVDKCLGGYVDWTKNFLPMVGVNNCNITMLDDLNTFWPDTCFQNIQS